MNNPETPQPDGDVAKPALQRRLTLPLLILYGLGVTVGAGIYVLVGITASEAGMFAPISFLLAAFIIAFTGFSYAELSTRFPVSAGEAAYVKAGLKRSSLALIVGLLVAASGIVSSATISIGAASYIQELVPMPTNLLTVIIILSLGLVAAWGILESVSMAAILTVVEVFGLGLVIYYGFKLKPDLLSDIGQIVPPFEMSAWAGISSAGLLAFFAFIGFEDLANVAEEAKNPRKDMPRAIILTIMITTFIYLAVVSVVVLSVPLNHLSGSASPLNLVFEEAGDNMKGMFNVIAGLATINGVLIQMIMSSRVLYGLAKQGQLPKSIAYIHPRMRTPIIATVMVVAAVLILALFLPIARLAETTSQITLTVFCFVNLALIALKLPDNKGAGSHFHVPIWVPVIGFITCALLIISSFL